MPEIEPQIAEPERLSNLHAFVSHGVDDGKLSINFAHRSQKLLSEKGVQLTYREYKAVHEFNADMQRDFFQWMSNEVDQSEAKA